MARANSVTIDIETTDKAGLSQLVAKYRREGKQLGDAIGDGFEQAERRTQQSTTKMSSVMRGTVTGMARELDKLERAAALSGDGMSAEYASALSKVRDDLSRVADAGAKMGSSLAGDTGAALRSVRKSIDELKPVTAEVDRAFTETGRNIERMLRRIEIEAHNAGDDIGRSMSEATRSMRADLERVEQQARRSGGRLDSEIGDALKKIQREARKTKEELEGALNPAEVGGDGGGGLGEMLAGGLSSGFDVGGLAESMFGAAKWAGPATAAGVAIGGFIWSGMEAEAKEDKIGAMISAQTGAAGRSAGQLGDIAGNIFADNFGDSIEQVGEALTAVFQNRLINTDAPEEAIERVTKKVLTLTSTTGESANEISRSARQLLVTGLADNMTAAMDMIQTATERGLNTTGELFDTIEEYSTQFRALGLNGQESFGLIDQAIEGGARNVDVAADALKEFQIRAQDMSETTKRGFRTLGLDAEVMGQRIAAGGDSAKGALQETLNRLRAMPDSVERNSAAVDLFGTKAEDLGDALFDMDLDTAAKQFGDFGGSVEEAAQKLANAQTGLDKFNKFVENTKSGLGEFLDSALPDFLTDVQADMDEVNLAKERFLSTGDTTWLDDLKEKYPDAAEEIDKFIESKEGEIDANQTSQSGYTELIETMDSYIGKLQETADAVLGLHDSQRDYHQAIDDAKEVIDDYGEKARRLGEGLTKNHDGFNLATEAGRDMQEALDEIADTALKTADEMDANAESIVDVNKHMRDARTRFIDAAIAMGISSKAANRLADELKLIPRKVSTTVEIRDAAAKANLAALRRAIDNIPRTITVSTYVRGANITPSGGGHMFLRESGGVTSGTVWGAQTGGARHGGTMINEAGPEIADLPNGTQVMTAGATRAAMEAGLVSVNADGGGIGRGPLELTVSWDGSIPDAMRGLIKGLRFEISNSYGGNVQRALGRGA